MTIMLERFYRFLIARLIAPNITDFKRKCLYVITKCGCNSLVAVHYISEFITFQLVPLH
jgi:hypothetical protein